MKSLFLDESGDHSLSVIDPQFPVFVLGGVIFDADYAANEMQTAVHHSEHPPGHPCSLHRTCRWEALYGCGPGDLGWGIV